jgi:addiction module HigA family antidote
MLKQGMAPAHPGEVLKGLYIEPLEITITDAAEKLDISRKNLSMLVNGRMGVSAEMALRLAKALNTTPELWLNMQQQYDLWQVGRRIDLAAVEVMVPVGRKRKNVA